MADDKHAILRAGDLIVDPADQRAVMGGQHLILSPKAFSLLSSLMRAKGRLVEKEQLFEQVWPGVTVGDAALTTVIKELRQALGDSAKAPDWIETVRGKGYRFGQVVQKNSIANAEQMPSRTIGVLPFEDLSPNGDQIYFADGVSEEILNVLAKTPGLRVAARTSSFAQRNAKKNISEIAEALNVAFILEGSVRKSNDKVRITAQLIQASDGYHQWSETFDGELTEIFALQERVASTVATHLCSVFARQNSASLPGGTLTQNLEAYDLYLQARSLMHSDYQADSFRFAIEKLERALEIDPLFCEAWCTLSQIHQQSFFYMGVPGRAAHEKSLEAARKAIAIREDAETLHRLSYALWQSNDKVAALRYFENMRTLAPTHAQTSHLSGAYHALLGQSEAAIRDYEQAITLDPLTRVSWMELAMTYQNADLYDRSDVAADRAIELGNYTSYTEKAWNAYARQDVGMPEIYFLNMYDAGGEDMSTMIGGRGLWEAIARAIFRDNHSDQAVLKGFLSMQLSSDKFEFDQASVVMMVYLGMNDELFDRWEAARFSVSNILLQRIWSDLPWAKSFRTHPRFPEFARQIGLVDAWQHYGWPDKVSPASEPDGPMKIR